MGAILFVTYSGMPEACGETRGEVSFRSVFGIIARTSILLWSVYGMQGYVDSYDVQKRSDLAGASGSLRTSPSWAQVSQWWKAWQFIADEFVRLVLELVSGMLFLLLQQLQATRTTRVVCCFC